MPVHRGKDEKGAFYQWGNQKRYYYIVGDKLSRNSAKKRAEAQGEAIRKNYLGGGFNKSIHDTGKVHPLAQFSAPHQDAGEIVGQLANEAVNFGKALASGPGAVAKYGVEKVVQVVGDVYRRDVAINKYKEQLSRDAKKGKGIEDDFKPVNTRNIRPELIAFLKANKGKYPDDVLQKFGREQFEKFISGAQQEKSENVAKLDKEENDFNDKVRKMYPEFDSATGPEKEQLKHRYRMNLKYPGFDEYSEDTKRAIANAPFAAKQAEISGSAFAKALIEGLNDPILRDGLQIASDFLIKGGKDIALAILKGDPKSAFLQIVKDAAPGFAYAFTASRKDPTPAAQALRAVAAKIAGGGASGKLPSGITTNIQLKNKLNKFPKFLGVFDSDHMPLRAFFKPGTAFIVNIDNMEREMSIPKSQREGFGTHWVCVLHGPKNILYLDPYGLDAPSRIKEWIGNNYGYSDDQYQPLKSESCGKYCVYFIWNFLTGKKFNKGLTENPSRENDILVNNFFALI